MCCGCPAFSSSRRYLFGNCKAHFTFAGYSRWLLSLCPPQGMTAAMMLARHQSQTLCAQSVCLLSQPYPALLYFKVNASVGFMPALQILQCLYISQIPMQCSSSKVHLGGTGGKNKKPLSQGRCLDVRKHQFPWGTLTFYTAGSKQAKTSHHVSSPALSCRGPGAQGARPHGPDLHPLLHNIFTAWEGSAIEHWVTPPAAMVAVHILMGFVYAGGEAKICTGSEICEVLWQVRQVWPCHLCQSWRCPVIF